MTVRADILAMRSRARPAKREAVLRAAECFLADTVEVIHPDTPAPVLLQYTARYRARLAAVVEARR
jgi:hypothetical protein